MKNHMANVSACDASSCAYNVDLNCHARAITVGAGVHPACDTYIPRARRPDAAADSGPSAGVGACKVTRCRHNQNLECEAPEIRVEPHEKHADCVTFALRRA